MTAAKPNVSSGSTRKKPLYEGSTQFQNWRFSPEQLAQTRAALNAHAVSVIRSTIEADEPGSSSNLSFLNADEELLLVKLYATKITALCGHLRFPEEVEATAVTYLKRFYLKNTVMDWHPKNVMLTALFLATKTTNNPISIEAYTSNIPRTAPADVLDLEFLVAQSLNFEFAVWHAHRALWGLWLDLESLSGDPPDLPQAVYDSALKHVRASRLTDAELIYTPSQIALACLSISSAPLAEQWLQSKVDLAGLNNSFPLHADLEAIKAMISDSGKPPDIDAVRDVDRRLKLCKNPEKVPGTKAYMARKAEEERAMEEKRIKKAEVIQALESDPFGDALETKKEAVAAIKELDDDD